MIDVIRDLLAGVGLIAIVWLALSCLHSYFSQPERRVPRPNVRSQRRDWDRHEYWRDTNENGRTRLRDGETV
jgi:hypothetical protein